MPPLQNLTPEEIRALQLVLQGLSETQIPHDLLDSLLKQAGVSSRVELLLYMYSGLQNLSAAA
jgi:DNA-binding NarL/FixJ family response regulator